MGNAVARQLLKLGYSVLGIDNLNDYYEVLLKEARLDQIKDEKDFRFQKLDISDRRALELCFKDFRPQKVIHLAAQAGVRYSLENPYAYVDSNIHGFINILENCRHLSIEHLIYASSSSVYGANKKAPFSESDFVDHPMSLYAATKKSNELMAYSYSQLFKVPVTGLRFFTVYGPWGRPDMAYYRFTQSIMSDQELEVYGDGSVERDFTFIDDVVGAMLKLLNLRPDLDANGASFALYNIGNDQPEKISKMISLLESLIGKKAKIKFLPTAPGDVPRTHADLRRIREVIDYQPNTSLESGLGVFVDWFRKFDSMRTNKNKV